MAEGSENVDIFGRELKISASERALVGVKDPVCLRKELFVDGKKEQEPRVIIVTNSICYVMVTVKSTVKVEASFHFLKIQKIESGSEKMVSFYITGEKSPREFKAKKDDDVLEVVTTIVSHLRNTLPLTPYQELIPLSLQPVARQKKVDVDSTKIKDTMTSPDVHSVNGFITVYAFLCVYYGIPFREDVAWNIGEIYLSHGFRVLKLNDFEQHNQRLLLPMVSSLEHNEYFEGVQQKDNELGAEVVNALSSVLQNQYRHGFNKLVLGNVGLKRDPALKLMNAVRMNPKSSLTHLDLSDNRLDDQCMEALCQMLSGLPHGLSTLELSDCGITTRGCVMLANSLKENKHMVVTLSTLNLSGNSFGPDSQGALSFLAEPNAVATLQLARCGIPFDLLFPVLCRGCSQSLVTLDLSDNNKVLKKGKASSSPPLQKIQQFFTSAIAVQKVNMSHASLTPEMAKAILEGLKDNPNVSNVSLDMSFNELGQGSLKIMSDILPQLSCVHELNLSHNGLDGNVPVIVRSLVSSSVKRLRLGGNFGKSKNPQETLTPLCQILSSKSCSFESLDLSDSKLKENMVPILEALLSNRSLLELDISGNDMGDRGARALARALMVNFKLRSVTWDDNGTTLEGLKSVGEALKYNHTMRSMPAPLRDALKISKDKHKERSLEEVLQEIQSYLYRNHSPERLTVESAARRQRQILLLTTQQQELDRSIVDLNDVITEVPTNAQTTSLIEDAEKVREEANKVMKVATLLYSDDGESRQTDAVINQLRSVSATLQRKLFEEHVQESSEKMVTETRKSLPHLLSSEDDQKRLESLVVGEMVPGFLEAEIVNRAGPEVANKISQYNLQVSTKVTRLIVEVALKALAEITQKLEEHLPPTPDVVRKSEGSGTLKKRLFSFSAQTKPTKYANKFKDDADEIDFGVVSELPMGPKLEHVTKSRPKPARTRRGSRRVLDETDGPGSDSVVSPPPTSPPVSNGDSKATDEASKTREEVKVVIDEPPVSPTKDKAKQKEPKSPKRSSKRESKAVTEGDRASPDGSRRKSGFMNRFSKKKNDSDEAKKEEKSDAKKDSLKGAKKEVSKEEPEKPPSPTTEDKQEEKPVEPTNTQAPPVKEKPKPAGPKVPLLPGGVGLGADVIAQMKKRQTLDFDPRKKQVEPSKATGPDLVKLKPEEKEPPNVETVKPTKEASTDELKEKEPSEEKPKVKEPPEEDVEEKESSEDKDVEEELPDEEKKEKEQLEEKPQNEEAKVEFNNEKPSEEEAKEKEPPKEELKEEVKESPKEEGIKEQPKDEEPAKEEVDLEEKEVAKDEPTKPGPEKEETLKQTPQEEPKKEEMKEDPKKEEPTKEESEEEESKKEEPKKEEIKVEPKKEESKKGEPKKEEPKKEEPKKEEPKKEEPKKEEPKKEEPKKEEPKKEEPKKEEPKKEEPKKEEPKKEEPKKEEPKKEEPKKEEPIKKEEPKKEEPKKEEPKKEEPKKEEPKKEEPKKEEPKKEEPKKEEPKKEEPKKEESKKEEPKKEEPKKEVPKQKPVKETQSPKEDVTKSADDSNKVNERRSSKEKPDVAEENQLPKVSPKPSPKPSPKVPKKPPPATKPRPKPSPVQEPSKPSWPPANESQPRKKPPPPIKKKPHSEKQEM